MTIDKLEVTLNIIKRAMNITENTEHDVSVDYSSATNSVWVYFWVGGFTAESYKEGLFKAYHIDFDRACFSKQLTELNKHLDKYEKGIKE